MCGRVLCRRRQQDAGSSLAGNVNRLQMELEALRRDGARRQLHASDGVQEAIRDAVREGALSDAVDAMKEGIRQEIRRPLGAAPDRPGLWPHRTLFLSSY